MNEKPVVFISHSSKDEELASVLKQQIEAGFENRLEVFVARYSIESSAEWLPEITRNLDAAKALVVIISPSSQESRWVGIEIGYLWRKISKRGKSKLPVYPLCMPNCSVFSPLDGIQGKFLDKPEELKNFFQSLFRQFNDGEIDKIDINAVVTKVTGNIQDNYEGFLFHAPEYRIGDTPYG